MAWPLNPDSYPVLTEDDVLVAMASERAQAELARIDGKNTVG